MVIYKVTNLLTGSIYVGKTKYDALTRWKAHLRDQKYSDTKFYRALKKYGTESFLVETLEDNIECEQRLNEREVYWIATIQPAYNTAKGGNGGLIGTGQLGRRWKIKDTSNMKTKKTITNAVIEGRARISGGSNYQCKYTIHTPWGVYSTWVAAVAAAKQLKQQGVTCLSDENTLKKYCLADVNLDPKSRRTPREWRGRSTKALGFFVVLKDEHGKT